MATKDGVGTELCERLRVPQLEMDSLARFLDSLSHADRVLAIREVGRSEQKRLYEAAEGFAPLSLVDLVSEATPAEATVRHFGKNTLPAFTHFEKHFCRPGSQQAPAPEELHGFNFQKLSPITGPGYFVAVASPEKPEILVDYRRVPERSPGNWPPVRSNERGLSRFVYGFMVDTLRRVSEHVTIGSAARAGKDMGSYFLLTREA